MVRPKHSVRTNWTDSGRWCPPTGQRPPRFSVSKSCASSPQRRTTTPPTLIRHREKRNQRTSPRPKPPRRPSSGIRWADQPGSRAPKRRILNRGAAISVRPDLLPARQNPQQGLVCHPGRLPRTLTPPNTLEASRTCPMAHQPTPRTPQPPTQETEAPDLRAEPTGPVADTVDLAGTADRQDPGDQQVLADPTDVIPGPRRCRAGSGRWQRSP